MAERKKRYPSIKGKKRIHGGYLGKKQYEKQLEEVFDFEKEEDEDEETRRTLRETTRAAVNRRKKRM